MKNALSLTTVTYLFRKAAAADLYPIWNMLQRAIRRIKAAGSDQWQDGYPNPGIVQNDIERGAGYVLTGDDIILAYCAVLVNDEPAYEKIEGKWLTEGDFVVVHRLVVAEDQLGKGLAKKLLGFVEDYARGRRIYSIKIDTNFDNRAMLNIFEKSGYVYCGEVLLRGRPRKAYEKVL